MSTQHPPARTWRLGIMGGTFDPIHIGHLAAASEAMGLLELDEVVFVPAGTPSHKDPDSVTAAEHRLAMVHLAVAGNPRFTVSRCELERSGPSFTRDTLAALREERGEGTELFFITGADVLPQVPTWNRAEGIFELAHFIGVHRGGEVPDVSGLPSERVSVCSLPALVMSSTEIRARVASNRPVWYWLPDTVITYIGKHGLYGAEWGYGSRR